MAGRQIRFNFEVRHHIVFSINKKKLNSIYRTSRPIRRTVISSLEILEKNNDECILGKFHPFTGHEVP